MPETLQLETGRRSPADDTARSHATQVEHIGRTGIYPASGPYPPGPAEIRGQGELGHPEEHRRQALLSGTRAGTLPLLLGRAIFGGFFLYNGINHFRHRQMMTEYARAKKVPAPEVAVMASGAMIAAGGLSLLTGTRPKIGASMIAGFLLGVSPLMHTFWREAEPQQKMNEMTHFTKNMAMLGGAMLAAAVPEPWPYAVNV
jgi:putative oxidoreductase